MVCGVAVLTFLSLEAHAQTITLTSGVQKYASLTSTTVNMSRKCELWVTNPTTPLSGCTINLNSTDAWLFFAAVKPSVVVSTYLGQVRVSGAAAVADTNCRVVQFGQNGAVVIPHSSSFQPLQVFSGPQFSGASLQYSQYTYYTGTAITNISSFKLKRGYQAVFAQSPNGANYSKCYVAQDGDMEVGVLPATLDKQVQFIYVTPWRWTPKKGIAGDPGIGLLNVSWWYNWNINSSSSRDLEYVAIRQQRWWPGLGANWKSAGINTVLGYNEPDSTSQANIAVGDAIWSWPDLLGTGLRVGSPATTDGGWSSWLYPFMSQADAAGLRVDFVSVHYYRCYDPSNPSGAASQMYNALKGIYDQTKRPLWITEWNNGANWTGCADPTYAQQQACISAMIDMLENAPFVERYALYNWVEDVRAVTLSGAVTDAGATYRDKVSNLSYLQVLPDNGTRSIAQYRFATNTLDSSGYSNNGMAVGAPAFTNGHNSQAQSIVLDGTNSYVQLPANIAKGSGFSFAAWVYWNGGGNWQRIFDFGNDTSQYLFLTPNSGSYLRFAIKNGGSEQIVQLAGGLASGSWQHVAVTLNGSTAILYVNGAQVASAAVTLTPSAFSPQRNYLGKSRFSSDPLFNGRLEDVEITDYPMTAAQISELYNSPQGPPGGGGVWVLNANSYWGTNGNWSGGIVANGAGFMADFSSIDITTTRAVTVDSPRTIGGLKFGDLSGAQNWIVLGTNALTLDGGGANAPAITVAQGSTTIFAPLSGSSGFAKNGPGALTLSGNNTVGGGLVVSAGSVGVNTGATAFGTGTSSVGYRTGSGTLTLTGGSLAMGGELRVGASDLNGTGYNAAGTVTVVNASLMVGSLTVARGNYLDNSVSGTITLNPGGTIVSTNDVILEYAGTGRGKLTISGGNFIIGPAASKWFMVGYYDSGGGELSISSGNLLLENGSSIKMCRSGNTGTNLVNQFGGNVTFYSDAGVNAGGNGNLDLNFAGGAASVSTYNLNGGTLTVPQVVASSSAGSGTLNFNGGTLRAAKANASFMSPGAGAFFANVRNNGAIIDTTNAAITIAQPLAHSSIAGDNPVDGGLTKKGAGTLTLSGVNTYTGNTTISEGTLALGAAGSIANSRSIAVAGGALLDVSTVAGGFTLGGAQTLSGSGTATGSVVLNGTLAPGASTGTPGTLTFSIPPTLNGTTLMKLDRNNGAFVNDQIALLSGAMAYGGTLTVTNLGAALQAGDTFQLFSAASYGGTFADITLPALGTDLAWSNSLAVNGSIAVVSVISSEPTNLLWSVSGTNLTLSWPADHTGWRLQVQTNAPAAGLGTNWFDVPDSAGTNTVSLPVDLNNGSVFYRLAYP